MATDTSQYFGGYNTSNNTINTRSDAPQLPADSIMQNKANIATAGGTVDTPAAIPVDNLGSSSVTSPSLPSPSIDANHYPSIIAGTIPPPAPNPTDQTTPYTNTSSSLLTNIGKLMGLDVNKAADTQKQNELAGVTKLNARQNEITGQLTSLNNEAQAIPLKTEAVANGSGATVGGITPITHAALRDNAIKALTLKSEFDVNQGNLQNAKDTAQRALDLVYQPIEQQIDYQTKLLQLYSPFMNTEQKAKADALTQKNEQAKTDLADKKKQQTDVVNAAQQAAKNGDTTASQLAGEALKLDPNSSTFKEDLATLQEKIQAKSVAPKIIGSATTGYFQYDPTTGKTTPVGNPNPQKTVIPKGSVTSGTLTYTPQDQKEDSQQLDASRGSDGFVDPNIYQSLYKLWIQHGGQLEDFLKTYPPKNYVNPANTFLPSFLRPTTKAKTSTREI